MANLVLTFTTSGASSYKITYQKDGGTTYTEYTSTSPWTLNNITCGTYSGTITAICDEGENCTEYAINNPSMDSDGDVEYTDCATGNLTTQAVTYGANFIVCSRTVPQIFNGASAATVSVRGNCGDPYDVEQSTSIAWTQDYTDCYYYFKVTPCVAEAPVPINNDVYTTDSTLQIGDVVTLTGSAYAGYCYTLSDLSSATSGVVIAMQQTDCNSCLT
jgi:hypothetical protein